MKTFLLILRLIVAAILLQTLFFKFTGAEESVHIFTQLGAEPYGRIGSVVIELIASVLLFLPNWACPGAGLALGTMSGAILSHLTLLGIEVGGDGGMLFGLAVVTWVAGAAILFICRRQIPIINRFFA